MARSKLLTLILAVGLVAPACRQNVRYGGGDPNGGGELRLDSAKPENVKANLQDAIELTGAGFSATSEVMINGAPATDIPGVSYEVMDSTRILVRFDGQSASWLRADDWTVDVLDGFRHTETTPLHVRPVLTRLEYVRTLPEFFSPDGGKLEIWAQPVDSEEIVMLPGHEVAGTDGLTKENFDWSGISLTSESGDVVTPSSMEIIRVIYGPRFTGDPLGFAVAIDNSGSMDNADGNGIRFEATKLFVDRLSPNAEMMTIGFSGSPAIRIPFTNDKTAIKDDLDTFAGEGAGGGTALYDAMILGLNELDTLGPEAAKIVIALTDGRDQDSSANAQDVIDLANSIGAQVFSIGLGTGNNLDSADLIAIAQATDAAYFQVDNADALPQIFEQLGSYQADSYRIEAQLAFDPPLTEMGKYLMTVDMIGCHVDDEDATTQITSSNPATIYVGQ